jgi:hypothetical protein
LIFKRYKSMFKKNNRLIGHSLVTTLSGILLCTLSMTSIAGVSETETQDHNIPLLALGPITAIDAENATIVVNGQRYIFDSQSSIFLPSSSGQLVELSGSNALSSLKTGSLITVHGELIESGIGLATIATVVDGVFVDGASEAYVKIIVDESRNSVGQVTSGGLVVDYTAALSNAASDLSSLKAGDRVDFIGTLHDNVLYASSTSPANNSNVSGTRGSGTRGTRGSGTRGTRGSGTRAADFSDLDGTRGSGTRGTRGSGTRGTRGSGTRGTRGSGTRGTRGSGTR